MTANRRPLDTGRAVAAGAIGTGVLTALWLVEPAVGLPNIAVGQILSTFMSVSVAHLHVGIAGGWVVHLVVGILLALAYAARFDGWLPGSPAARGALYGALVFLVAQIVFMPLVGAGLFSRGDTQLLLGSLLGHLAYGVVVGWIYDLPPSAAPGMALPRRAGATLPQDRAP
jgi:hypothetical protein